MDVAGMTADPNESASPLVIEHADRISEQAPAPLGGELSELEQHKRARGYVKDEAPAKVEEPPPAPETQPDAKPEEKKQPERWKDPDTGDTYDMRHKVARRIKTVLEDRGKEKSRADKAESEAQYWRRRAEEIERDAQAQPKPETKPQAQTASTDDPEPDPADLTKYPEGQFDRGFIRDMGRWAARQETKTTFEAQRSQADEARARQAEVEQVTQWQGTLPEARKRYADFDTALERIPNTPDNAPIVRLMMSSPVGNDVVYALATQTTGDGVPLMQLYQRAPGMDSKLRLLHHIEAQLIQAHRSATTKTQTSRTSAPPPIDPVNTAAATGAVIDWSRTDDPDQLQRWKSVRQNRR